MLNILLQEWIHKEWLPDQKCRIFLCLLFFLFLQKKATTTKIEFYTNFQQIVSCVATDKSIDELLY